MQTILGTVTSHLGWKNHPFTLDILPLTGISDGTQSIRDVKGRLLQTLQVLDGLLKAPFGLTSVLRTQLENVRFHVVNGLTLVDAAERLGYSLEQPASDIDGLFATIDNHKLAIERTRGTWTAWLKDAHAQQTVADAPLPIKQQRSSKKPVAIGFGADESTTQSLTPYLIAGGVALVMYMVMK